MTEEGENPLPHNALVVFILLKVNYSSCYGLNVNFPLHELMCLNTLSPTDGAVLGDYGTFIR